MKSFIIPALLLLLCFSQNLKAEEQEPIRLLFVLDASGSMNELFDGQPKFATAVKLLYELSDSIQKYHPEIEIGLRLFGHQYPYEEEVCDDSKLVVQFAKNNASSIQEKLKSIKAQGWTPLAYALQKASLDFDKNKDYKNVVVLITDGYESCEGDPCSAGKAFRENGIALEPYIIGIGLNTDLIEKLKCVGTVSNVQTIKGLVETIQEIVEIQSTNAELLIRFIHPETNEPITDIPFELMNTALPQRNKKYIHAIGNNEQIDTLTIDPYIPYQIKVFTSPEYISEPFQAEPKQLIKQDLKIAPGTLSVLNEKRSSAKKFQVVIYDDNNEIISIQNSGTTQKYLNSNFNSKILSQPDLNQEIIIRPGKENILNIPNTGTLNISISSEEKIIGLFKQEKNELEKIWESNNAKGNIRIDLMPGSYLLMHRNSINTESIFTIKEKINIKSSQTITLRL